MFGVAEDLLRQAGMEFRDVVRTWIHLREMERDYADLNRARRAFFEARGIDPARRPAPASAVGRFRSITISAWACMPSGRHARRCGP